MFHFVFEVNKLSGPQLENIPRRDKNISRGANIRLGVGKKYRVFQKKQCTRKCANNPKKKNSQKLSEYLM